MRDGVTTAEAQHVKELERENKDSVALLVDERVFSRNECQRFRLDAFFLPMRKTGRQTTSHDRP